MSDSKSYGRILRASSIMGGAAVVCLLLGLVRTKATALLIGVPGVGMIANFTALQGVLAVFAGLGIQTSAVRAVAAAVAGGDEDAIGETIVTLRRVCWITGLLGACFTTVASPLLSEWTFGAPTYAPDITLIGAAIFLGNIYSGQVALIQGMRRIGDLARIQIVAAVAGAAIFIVFFGSFGVRAVAPALLLTAATQLVASWQIARRIPIPAVSVSWPNSLRGAIRMARIGAAVMWSAVLINLTNYLASALITHQIDVQALGVYSAAFALSGVFVNFILNAMATDYYPRLAEVAHRKEAMHVLISHQIEIGALLATPGLLVMLAFAPWVVQLLYTEQFQPAAHLLQWFILGCFGRVIAWPLGFVLLAVNAARQFVLLETFFSLSHLLLIAVGLRLFGLEGVAGAFFLAYALYFAVIAVMVNHLIGYRWPPDIARLLWRVFLLLSGTFVMVRVLPPLAGTLAATFTIGSASLICIRCLIERIGESHPLIRTLQRFPAMKLLVP